MNLLKNMYIDDRMVLKDKIPLRVPLCISIEPSNICNFKCVMCFHGNNECDERAKPLKNMDMECFEKTVMDIKKWVDECDEKVKLIKLYSLGEPLIHPNICEMVKRIKELNICDELEITTNASLLNEEIAEKLVDSGLDILRISIYGVNVEQHKYITKSLIMPEKIRENVLYLKKYREEQKSNVPKIITKMLDTYSEENQKFLDSYKGIVDMVGIDEPFQLQLGDADVFENLYQENAKEAHECAMKTNLYDKKKACRYPFTHMTIRSDGKVVVCCSDWIKELSYGNVMEHSLKELWESKTLYDVRCKMLKHKGENWEICKNCEIPYWDAPEDAVDEVDIKCLKYSNNF